MLDTDDLAPKPACILWETTSGSLVVSMHEAVHRADDVYYKVSQGQNADKDSEMEHVALHRHACGGDNAVCMVSYVKEQDEGYPPTTWAAK
jgi:hypothetical protein